MLLGPPGTIHQSPSFPPFPVRCQQYHIYFFCYIDRRCHHMACRRVIGRALDGCLVRCVRPWCAIFAPADTVLSHTLVLVAQMWAGAAAAAEWLNNIPTLKTLLNWWNELLWCKFTSLYLHSLTCACLIYVYHGERLRGTTSWFLLLWNQEVANFQGSGQRCSIPSKVPTWLKIQDSSSVVL